LIRRVAPNIIPFKPSVPALFSIEKIQITFFPLNEEQRTKAQSTLNVTQNSEY
jgi:hypothetical protein